jgi:hypothetical protein
VVPEGYQELRKALAVVAMHGHRLLHAGGKGDRAAADRRRADLDASVPLVLALAGERDRRRGRWRLAGGMEPFLAAVRKYAEAADEEERSSFFELLETIYAPPERR